MKRVRGSTIYEDSNLYVESDERCFGGTTEQKSQPLYIFSRGEGEGFVVVSGDDCLPAIIGYTESGDYDEENMPPDKVIEIFQQAINDAESLLTALPNIFDDIFDAQQALQKAQQEYINNVLPTLRGDANGDGEINIDDAMCVANAILGNPGASFDEKAADANLDGVIGMSDVMYTVNYILNGKFPEEE